MTPTREFRVAWFPSDFERSVAFYRDALELPVRGSWDRGPGDRGMLFAAGPGSIELLAGRPASIPPRGVWIYVEVDDVDAWHARATGRGVPIAHALEDTPWGHRRFHVVDPDGVEVGFFSQRAAPGGSGVS
ncbi:MAG TPA: VOC family protein [Candidatus Polarisedimenticolaceae bacterium]|nr:VOC family protein [Candidatus Polarisedimenticolaceae bacterium]